MQVNGRHLGNARLVSANIHHEINHHEDGTVSLRLDDEANLAWWLEINLNKEDLKEILNGMDKVSN